MASFVPYSYKNNPQNLLPDGAGPDLVYVPTAGCTTAALNGQCVGMFSATSIISNNGVRWNASVSDMAKSNFYYFYYHYLKALNERQSRSQAFFTAQREYAAALMEDKTQAIRGEGNVQFNLNNLLVYHNFGVIEPDAMGWAYWDYDADASDQIRSDGIRSDGKAGDKRAAASEGSSGREQEEIPVRNKLNISGSLDLTGEIRKIRGSSNLNLLLDPQGAVVHQCTVEIVDDSTYRFTIDYTMPKGLSICVFDPPDSNKCKPFGQKNTSGERELLVFDLSAKLVDSLSNLNINFFRNDQDRFFCYLYL